MHERTSRSTTLKDGFTWMSQPFVFSAEKEGESGIEGCQHVKNMSYVPRNVSVAGIWLQDPGVLVSNEPCISARIPSAPIKSVSPDGALPKHKANVSIATHPSCVEVVC